MGSTFSGLNTVYTGIQAHQLALDTVGQNLSNDSTEGYSRQSVNLVATKATSQTTLYGTSYVGSGVASASITRARDTFADKNYWNENSTNSYYEAVQNNYTVVENVFNDSEISDTEVGLQSSINSFWETWQSLGTDASSSDERISTRDTAVTMADKIKSMASDMQSQISTNYSQLQADVSSVNTITAQIADLNKSIIQLEANGGSANDLRDQRDELVDNLSKYLKVNVTEKSNGSYTISSDGSNLVDEGSSVELATQASNNSQYGVTDYTLTIKATGTIFNPSDGEIKALQDNVSTNKSYIDKLADYSAFFLTTFNAQHKEGYGIDGANSGNGTTDTNFFGEDENSYQWIDEKSSSTEGYEDAYVEKTNSSDGTTEKLRGISLINELTVNSKITADGGTNYIATKGANKYTDSASYTDTNGNTVKTGDYIDANGNKVDYADRITASNGTAGTADGTNAVSLSTLFNTSLGDATSISDTVKTAAGMVDSSGNYTGYSSTGNLSLNDYYNDTMTKLGSDSSNVDDYVTKTTSTLTELDNTRQSVSGVNWNEELTNMIKYQQGYSACARILTTMDEMLDKLINSTGTVGR
ncbi:flagellar hook-associated protein FlgK [Pectinatus haikarae]|uniref:Flagellar hook-associated protein 1 n=1 Tax=Pectinatus haikarae TaxID=349096 RepID=A0ABT9Y5J4_9FIRM|nr:flagellar hook-associated protein FlgK [Pectinatus haikarae]MDQ0202831.1 flagellar hook-associated protein 1 FlgK [Pectinatus haikarae]